MQDIIRNVSDIDAAHRKALEHVVGRSLREDQQVIITVRDLKAPSAPPEIHDPPAATLPEWCNVYEGLSEEEIEEIEKSIVRSDAVRHFDA